MKRSSVACRLPVSLKTERAARSLGPSLGWPWLCMVDTRQERVSPLWGNDSARETVRCALLSTTPVTPVPPPWVWALPTVSSAGDGGPPGAPCFLARRRYLRPGPTALHGYRAPRREDKSDTEETMWKRMTHRGAAKRVAVPFARSDEITVEIRRDVTRYTITALRRPD